MIVKEEINRAKNNESPVSSLAESMERPDSLHGEDDEDRIPDELLLKYTKADSLCQDDYPVERNVSPAVSGGRNSATPRSGGNIDSGRSKGSVLGVY